MSISFSKIISNVCLNPAIKNLLVVKLFQVDSVTKKSEKEYKTKVTARTKLSALIQTQDMNLVPGFCIEVNAHATGVARHKVLDTSLYTSITAQSIQDIAALELRTDRRNAVVDLILKEMARIQFTIIQSEINSTKNYDDLFNNKVFQEWFYSYSKPLHPQTDGLDDNYNLVDATYQIASSGYIEIVSYFVDLIEKELTSGLNQTI
ncbi:hypothetical protein MUB04_15480 [Acinetobacter indicus]|uniref:hypothetical protein n=1 Tax=Acinetobacter TaxID=469 RepID=UPI0015D3897F|nr:MULTISPECIES: hypothetical protein [Acinetobacter]MCP0917938.1 hypothetical protein [Acinetobacter indicus]